MIDLRSDTVTRPTSAMREAMLRAEVGDDVLEDDPTVRRLEHSIAERLGKEDALFTPSSTQSNLIAVLCHCGRGDEYLVGQEAHNYLYEAGGAAVLGGVQPQPLLQESDGTLDLGLVEKLIKPDDFHFARTRLLSLENTTSGKILPTGYAESAKTLANAYGLSTHLDGARLFNASVASGEPIESLAAPFDSLSICLSKGLGAPVGSLLVGSGALVKAGKRWRKMLGGGMRQSGILAAAGLHALEHHVDRLDQDHANAEFLAAGLSQIEALQVEPVQTNMVFVSLSQDLLETLTQVLKSQDILVGSYGRGMLRLVTHLDVTTVDIARVIQAVKDHFGVVPDRSR